MPLAYFLDPFVHPLRVVLHGDEHLLLAEVKFDFLTAYLVATGHALLG